MCSLWIRTGSDIPRSGKLQSRLPRGFNLSCVRRAATPEESLGRSPAAVLPFSSPSGPVQRQGQTLLPQGTAGNRLQCVSILPERKRDLRERAQNPRKTSPLAQGGITPSLPLDEQSVLVLDSSQNERTLWTWPLLSRRSHTCGRRTPTRDLSGSRSLCPSLSVHS